MTNEDYQLEELENAAVKKSNNAKRVAAATGLLAAGGAAGYAATQIPLGSDEEMEDPLTEEDLEGVADTGANQVQEPETVSQSVQPAPQYAAPSQSESQTEAEADVSFDKTVHYYDENNNLIMTSEEGTIDGRQFKLIDVDGDMRADVLGYDADGNGVINENEVVYLSGKDQIAMGHSTSGHEDVFVDTHNEHEPVVESEPFPYDIDNEKDLADNNIHNDFEDEKTGESYSHDYAEDNEDYNNNGDVQSYNAGSDYACNEEDENVKDDSDYEYDSFAENDSSEDSFDDLGSDSIDLV